MILLIKKKKKPISEQAQQSYLSGVSGRHPIMLYSVKAQLPLRLLCYDLSSFSVRVTGDLYTP